MISSTSLRDQKYQLYREKGQRTKFVESAEVPKVADVLRLVCISGLIILSRLEVLPEKKVKGLNSWSVPVDLKLHFCSTYYTIQVDYFPRPELFSEKRSKDKSRGEYRSDRVSIHTLVLSPTESKNPARLEALSAKVQV